MKPALFSAFVAAGKSLRRNRMSTSCVLRTAASSTRETHAATAFPPATAYGIPAASRAATARRNRSRTFSTARIILSQETSPIAPGLWLQGAAPGIFNCPFVAAVPIGQLYPEFAHNAKAGIFIGFLG